MTFGNTNVKMAFRCRDTIANLIKHSKDHNIPPHNKWGIYQLTCNTCNLVYIGQASRSLNIRFPEHVRYIRNNNPQSAYAQHILQNQHEYGQMNSIMTLLKLLNNSSLLIPYQQYYIQTLYREGKLIPEQNPGEINPLFQTIINRLKAELNPICHLLALLGAHHILNVSRIRVNPQPPTFHMNRPVVLQPATRIPLQPYHT